MSDGAGCVAAGEPLNIEAHLYSYSASIGNISSALPFRQVAKRTATKRTPVHCQYDDAPVQLRDDGVVRSYHEGRGRFAFRAERGRQYLLHVVKPTGVLFPVDLPSSLGRQECAYSHEASRTHACCVVTVQTPLSHCACPK